MILRLSPRQIAACRIWLTERHREFFKPVKVSSRRIEVAMPAAAWSALADVLFAHAFRPSGRSDGRAPAGTRSALHAIARGLARLESHPAMVGEMVRGYSGDVLTAWPSAWPSAERFSPYPVPGESMVILVPHLHDKGVFAGAASGTVFTSDVTSWNQTPKLDAWAEIPGLFLDPADHEGWGQTGA